MRIIDHRRFDAVRSSRQLSVPVRRVLTAVVAVVALLAIVNLAMAIGYRNKVLPNYSVGAAQVGNIPFDELDRRVGAKAVLPSEVVLTKGDVQQKVSPADVGIIVDWPSTREQIRKARLWLPVLSLVTKHRVEPKLEVASLPAAEVKLTELQETFHKEPVLEHITFKDGAFSIVPSEKGYVLDVVGLQRGLIRAIEQQSGTVAVPTTETAATSSLDLKPHLDVFQAKLSSKITLMHAGKSQQLTPQQIGQMYAPNGQSMALSIDNMRTVVAAVASSLGVTPINQDEAVQAAMYAINRSQTVNFVLAAQNTTVYHYCVAAKGISADNLPDYRQKLAAAYGDPRGWGQGGVALVYAESGCDFTAWLSAPGLMTSFGAICDSYYSCRVGPNVVVNFDRWNGATAPWNAAGGSLEDYRSMVINHETGHWFGFGHRHCPGAGQPAPVMQQQSIDLQGCSFNPWPTAAEIAAL